MDSGSKFHGFVMWRVEDGKLVERCATVTPFHEAAAGEVVW